MSVALPGRALGPTGAKPTGCYEHRPNSNLFQSEGQGVQGSRARTTLAAGPGRGVPNGRRRRLHQAAYPPCSTVPTSAGCRPPHARRRPDHGRSSAGVVTQGVWATRQVRRWSTLNSGKTHAKGMSRRCVLGAVRARTVKGPIQRGDNSDSEGRGGAPCQGTPRPPRRTARPTAGIEHRLALILPFLRGSLAKVGRGHGVGRRPTRAG